MHLETPEETPIVSSMNILINVCIKLQLYLVLKLYSTIAYEQERVRVLIDVLRMHRKPTKGLKRKSRIYGKEDNVRKIRMGVY